MSFLTSTPDLTGTIFTLENLEYSRYFFTTKLKGYLPSWIDNPTGELKIYWNRNDVEAACYLIELCRLLFLLDKRRSERSEILLREKIKQLFTLSEKQFNETLAEIQIGWLFSEMAQPISFEPKVPESKLNSSKKPKSPDFGIRLPDGDVFIEASVLNFKQLYDWYKISERLEIQLWRLVQKLKLRRLIRLELPLSFGKRDITQKVVSELKDKMITSSIGEHEFIINKSNVGRIKWEHMPHIEIPNNTPEDFTTRFPEEVNMFTAASEDTEIHSSIGIAKILTDTIDDEVLYNAIISKLKEKKDQFKGKIGKIGIPYLLVIKPNLRINKYSIEAIINKRIWPNRLHSWVTGICLFYPRKNFEKDSPPPSLTYILNPNADNKPSKSLMDMLEGKKKFQYKEGKFLIN